MRGNIYIVDPHYLLSPYFQVAYFLKCTCNPKINVWGTFIIFHNEVQSSEKFKLPEVHSQLRSKEGTLPCCLRSHTVYECPFHNLFTATSFTSCFLLLLHCLKWPPPQMSG